MEEENGKMAESEEFSHRATDTATQVVSLAYYVFRAKRAGVSHDDFHNGGEYHAFLESKIDLKVAAEIWAETNDDVLVPLWEIDLPETDCLDIVDQIYRGFRYADVRISAVAAPPRPTHTPYYPKYLQTISEDTLTGTAVEATLSRLNEVIDNKAVATARGNGLVVGRVQSGKTRNYIGVILKAVDEGWNVVIVLTSAIKSLAKQTRNRISDTFEKVGANNRQHVAELDFLSKTDNERAGQELEGDFFYWGVSMKQVDGLNRIFKWLDRDNQPLRSMRVLIIDDESDSATPDSNARDPGNLSDEDIADRIESIRRAPGFTELADWFEYLRGCEWPDIGAKTSEAKAFEEVCDLLQGNSRYKVKRDTIVNTAIYRRLLGMDQFANPPVENLITRYFHSQSTGNADDTYKAFALLLKSILDLERERSAINAAVCKLIGPSPETGSYAYQFGRCAYLGYTATPYANILNEGPASTPLYADFIQSLEIPPHYFGAEAIFGHDIDAPEPRMPVVNYIPDDEGEEILAPLRSSESAIDGDLALPNGKEWKSLKEAVAWTFCTAAARRRLRMNGIDAGKRDRREHRWTTLIVNLHHAQIVHTNVKNILDRFVRARCATETAREAFAEYCHSVWNEQKARFTHDDFDRILNGGAIEPSRRYGPVSDYPDWSDILPNLMFFLENSERHVHAIEMNSTEAGVEEQALYAQDADAIQAREVRELPSGDHLWLVSGGNTIGRGLTLDGLTCSYFDRVRSTTCVDTLTQMGRWFGYREGYELLQRVWMLFGTVGEMKRIADTELKLHESLADNFKQKFSPADPAHFQQISSWGRRLSGRAFAQRTLSASIGTTASTDDYYSDAANRRNVFDICSAFVEGLGPQTPRSPDEYLYADTPLWEDVDRNAVHALLERLLPFHPEQARKILRGVMREICASDPVNWDVVVGNPSHGHGSHTVPFGGMDARFGTPGALPLGDGTVRTSSARLHLSFYAMIRSEHLFREDTSLVSAWIETIAESIDQRRIQNDGVLPRQYEEALPGEPDESVFYRLQQLVFELEEANGARPVPEAIHARLGDASKGLRNRSSAEYMASVHKSANHVRPVLQLYLIRPEILADDAPPLVNISFYWPSHDPDTFFNVAVAEYPESAPMVTPRVFCQNVEDILRERDFPMQRKELLKAVLGKLGLRCNEGFFAQHIGNPLAGYTYHKMAGRNAYCIDGWAADEESRLASEFLQTAIAILQRDRIPYTTEDLIQKVIDEEPRFRDFFVPRNDNTKVNNLMTDEVLNGNDIAVICRHPVTYRYGN